MQEYLIGLAIKLSFLKLFEIKKCYQDFQISKYII